MIRRKKAEGKRSPLADARGRRKEQRHGTRHWTQWRRETTSWPVLKSRAG